MEEWLVSRPDWFFTYMPWVLGAALYLGYQALKSWVGGLNAKTVQENPGMFFGPISHEVVCPHCHVQGKVRLRSTKEPGGISGAKATGAVLTGGASVLVTGLSKKEDVTYAFCENCHVHWRLGT